MKVAVIDIGTLKIKFLIAEITSPLSFTTLYSSNTLTRLGTRMHENNNRPFPENLDAAIQELKRCKEMIDKEKVEKVRAVSTHALREMGQAGKDIVEKVKREVGLDIEIISQDEEADLFFKAVINEFDTDEDLALVDVGGGSVQILIGNKKKLKHVFLLKMGAQYLEDHFISHEGKDVPTKEEVEKIQNYIDEQLSALPKNLKTPIVHGSSCIIDAMEALPVKLDPYTQSQSHPYKVTIAELTQLFETIVYTPYQERLTKFPFPQQKYFMWGFDMNLLNIISIAEHLNSPYIIPTNANINNGLVLSLVQA